MDDILQLGAIVVGIVLLAKSRGKAADTTDTVAALPEVPTSEQWEVERDANGRWKTITMRYV